MIDRKRITLHAHDAHRGMTIDELATFLDHARTVGAHGPEPVRATIGFRHGIKTLTIDIAGNPTQ